MTDQCDGGVMTFSLSLTVQGKSWSLLFPAGGAADTNDPCINNNRTDCNLSINQKTDTDLDQISFVLGLLFLSLYGVCVCLVWAYSNTRYRLFKVSKTFEFKYNLTWWMEKYLLLFLELTAVKLPLHHMGCQAQRCKQNHFHSSLSNP